MIYLYNKKENFLKPLRNETKSSKKPKSYIPMQSDLYSGAIVQPQADYGTIKDYRDKSETHMEALRFKSNNTVMSGYKVINDQNGFADGLMNVNSRGENFLEVITTLVNNYYEFGLGILEVRAVDNAYALYNAPPDDIWAELNKGATDVVNYIYRGNYMNLKLPAKMQNSRYKRFAYPIKMLSNRDAVFGYPDWTSAFDAIDINYDIDTWIQSFLENNARFDYLVVTSGDILDEDEQENLKTGLAGHKGLDNKGKAGYMGLMPDTTVDVIELNKVDHSHFFAGKGEYIQQIIQAHSLSPQTLNFSRGGQSLAGNEIVGAIRKDYRTYIKPHQNYIESKINNLFLQLLGFNPDIRFNQMDVTSAKEKALIYEIFMTNKVIPSSYVERHEFPDMTEEEKREVKDDRENNDEETSERKDRDIDKQAFDETGNTGAVRKDREEF